MLERVPFGPRYNSKGRIQMTKQDFRIEDRGYETPCWVFTNPLRPRRTGGGYSKVRIDGKQKSAYRAMYEQLVGAIPEGLQIDHLCRNPACINPDHLEPVTGAVNTRRRRTAKLTEKQVREIRAGGATAYEFAERFGVSHSLICMIRRGEIWQGV